MDEKSLFNLNLKPENVKEIKLTNVKLSKNFVDSLCEYKNLESLDMSENYHYYIKKNHDINEYIQRCKDLQKMDPLSYSTLKNKSCLLFELYTLKLDYSLNVITQLEDLVKYSELLEKFYEI